MSLKGLNSLCLNKLLFAMQNVIPVLKWVRGEPLSQDHWLELFRLIKMPRGTTLEKLTFGDLLASSQHISANADALKVGLKKEYSKSMWIFFLVFYLRLLLVIPVNHLVTLSRQTASDFRCCSWRSTQNPCEFFFLFFIYVCYSLFLLTTLWHCPGRLHPTSGVAHDRHTGRLSFYAT